MLEYLAENHGKRPAINTNERMELEFLRDENEKLKAQLASTSHGASTADDDADLSQSQSDSEEDEVADLPIAPKPAADRKPRISVSAEAFGKWNKKEDFAAPEYAKSDEIKQALKTRLEQAFMFSALNPDELEIVLLAMQDVNKKAGELVIKEGDEGDVLYVVEKGELACTKIFSGNTEPTWLKDYAPGEAFGELALLYNAPRAATITAKTDAALWSLDRRTFNHIVKDSAQRKRDKYEMFLQKVSILENMDTYERAKLADAIKEEWYEEGDYVITEGQAGDVFYLVMSGSAVATKTLEPGTPATQVYEYKEGDYFGERALLKNEPRAANIVATTRLQLVALERKSFRRLLGPIDTILKRNMENYSKFCS